MLHNLTRSGLTALLLAAFVGPARAAEPPLTESEKIDAIYRQLRTVLPQVELKMSVAEGELKDLRRRIEVLEGQLRTRDDSDRSIRRAFSPSNTSGAIMLHNRTAQAATVVLDGMSYSLSPFEMVTLAGRPVGPINYEVFVNGWGLVQPRTTRMLATDRPFSVYVNP